MAVAPRAPRSDSADKAGEGDRVDGGADPRAGEHRAALITRDTRIRENFARAVW
jgi:hypothetical protein